MRALIIGCGAIGGHIAYCLNKKNFEVTIIAKKDSAKKINQDGLKIQVNNNQKKLISVNLKTNSKFSVYQNLNEVKKKKFDFIFITVKLKDFNTKLIRSISKICDSDTAIIPPCTNIPLWWINNFYGNKIKNKKKNYFKMENIIGLTMWISSEKKSLNKILVRHVQRGYPLKEINKKMHDKAKKLREVFKSTCKSPKIRNIYAEVFIKSLNALAFNMVALFFNQNNRSLKKNKKAIEMIKKIMIEGEQIIKFLKISYPQNCNERIKQTLSSSVHTMSMLSDLKKKKDLELKYLWHSFEIVLNLTKIKMEFTKKIYGQLLKKLKLNEFN